MENQGILRKTREIIVSGSHAFPWYSIVFPRLPSFSLFKRFIALLLVSTLAVNPALANGVSPSARLSRAPVTVQTGLTGQPANGPTFFAEEALNLPILFVFGCLAPLAKAERFRDIAAATIPPPAAMIHHLNGFQIPAWAAILTNHGMLIGITTAVGILALFLLRNHRKPFTTLWFSRLNREPFGPPLDMVQAGRVIKQLAESADSPNMLSMSSDRVRLVKSVLNCIPARLQKQQMDRLQILGLNDFHGLRRWFKDIAWLAGLERLKNHPEQIDLGSLPDQMHGAHIVTSAVEYRRLATALTGETVTKARKQLAEGKAILCLGHEVRFHPAKQEFFVSEVPIQVRAPTAPPVSTRAPPKIVVSILVYNGWQEVDSLLDDLSSSEVPNLEVVVLDNASTTFREHILREKFANAPFRLITKRSDVNLGYDEGHNVVMDYALDEAMADHVLLLNDDVKLDRGFMKKLLRLAEYGLETIEPRRIGAIAPLSFHLENGQPTDELFSNGGMFPRLRHLGISAVYNATKPRREGDPQTMVVDYVVGPAVLFASTALRHAGGFDPRWFAYAEELYLGVKLRSAGYIALITGTTRLWHASGASSGGRDVPFKFKFNIRNYILDLRTHRELHSPRGHLFGMSLVILRFVAVYLRAAIRKKNPALAWAVFEGFVQGVLGKSQNIQAGSIATFESPAPGSKRSWQLVPLGESRPNSIASPITPPLPASMTVKPDPSHAPAGPITVWTPTRPWRMIAILVLIGLACGLGASSGSTFLPVWWHRFGLFIIADFIMGASLSGMAQLRVTGSVHLGKMNRYSGARLILDSAWYFLKQFFSLHSEYAVPIRVLADQILGLPSLRAFFWLEGRLKGLSAEEVQKAVKRYWKIALLQLTLWVPANYYLYSRTPDHARLIPFINGFLTFIYSAILALLTNTDSGTRGHSQDGTSPGMPDAIGGRPESPNLLNRGFIPKILRRAA